MYTEENKGFTIITNFGCDCNCNYCITKHHPILQNSVTDESKINWKYLEECISKSNAPTVNISGGGDPFYEYDKHLEFYNKVYEIAYRYGKQLDIHTRILPDNIELLKLFRKIALSIEYWDNNAINNLRKKFDEYSRYVKIRVIQVVDSKLTEYNCKNYINTLKEIGVEQITFRQMFGNRKAYEHFELLKNSKWGKGVLFLKDGEYHNYYFTTTNELYPYFFGNSLEDRLKWMKIYEDIEQSCN